MKAAEIKPRWTPVLPFTLLMMATANIFNVVGLLGPLTVAIAYVYALAAMAGPKVRATAREPVTGNAGRVPLALWAFVVYVTVWMILAPNARGLQNLLVWFAFVAGISLTARYSSKGTADLSFRLMRKVAIGASLVYLLSVGVGGFDTDLIYNARAFAMIGLVGIIVSVVQVNTDRKSRAPIAVMLLAIAGSLSRTSLATGWVLTAFLAFRRSRPSGILKALLGAGVLAALGVWAIRNIAPIRDRFASNDGVSYFGIEVGTTGRDALWRVTLGNLDGSAQWLLGRGPGSSEVLITQVFGGRIGHPHNEYVRVLHDYGWLGMALILIGMTQLGLGCYRRWRAAETAVDRRRHQAGAMAFVLLAAMAVTSNISVFMFAMVPLSTLLGLSLAGSGSPRRSSAVRTMPRATTSA